MTLNEEQSEKLKQSIIDQFKKYRIYTDDILPEYILVMIANDKDLSEIETELRKYIDESYLGPFIEWLKGYEFQEPDTAAMEMEISSPEIKSIVKRKPSYHSKEIKNRATLVTDNKLFKTAMKELSSNTHLSKEERDGLKPMDKLNRPLDSPRNPIRGRNKNDRKLLNRDGNLDWKPRQNRHSRENVERKITVVLEDGKIISKQRRDMDDHHPYKSEKFRDVSKNHSNKSTFHLKERIAAHNEDTNLLSDKKKTPCIYFPYCRAGDQCPYYHLPNASNLLSSTSSVDSLHQGETMQGPIASQTLCKFDIGCKNPSCPYIHSSPAKSPPVTVSTTTISSTLCKYHPYCSKPACPYLHPQPAICRYGEECRRPDCVFKHSDSTVNCTFGLYCSRPYCTLNHPETHFKNKTFMRNFSVSNAQEHIISGQSSSMNGRAAEDASMDVVIDPPSSPPL